MCDTRVLQLSVTMLATPQIYDCPCRVSVRVIGSDLKTLKPLPLVGCNDYPSMLACHLVRSGRKQPQREHCVPGCGWWGCLHFKKSSIAQGF